MINGFKISFLLLAGFFAILVLVTGCAQVPTIQHCSEVQYERKGIDITVIAKCQVPLGSSLPGL